jgi:aryl-alcohol dehydrogenase-like predicted oxidoreductase
MKHVQAGGVRVSAIGLGTWQFGSREWGYGSEYAQRDAVAITNRALDLGIDLIDTAEIYAFGRSERIVGLALAGRRDRAFVATKVFPAVPLAPVIEQRGRASRERLGIDVIDLYQLHWPNALVPLGQQMAGMRSLREKGVVRHVGVSNYSLARWKDADAALGAPVLSNQVQYSLAARGPDQGGPGSMVRFAADNDRIVIAYSPLAQGFLSARYDRTNAPGGVRAGNRLFLPENIERAQPLFAELRRVAAAHGASPAQIALAWVIRRPNVVAIPGASSVAQLEANAAAADIDLTDDEDRALTEASDAFRPVAGLQVGRQLVEARFRR